MATCCNIEELHLDDVGTIIQVTVNDVDANCNLSPLNISGATTLQMTFKKPSGTTVTKTAVLTNDGTDGIMEYTTVEGDIDEPGTWKIQVYVELPIGKWRSNIGDFKVYRNL